MDPVTHLLTGACLSRSGCNRLAGYATLTMVVAAEFPDVDTLWALRGPIEGLQHHRGITHTFVGLPFEAALIVAAVYGLHRWRLRRAAATARAKAEAIPLRLAAGQDEAAPARPLTAAPVRWGVLYLLALVALLSHLLLDYTNNYGLRPFFPIDDRWYAGSIVFIFDPVIFTLLLAALVAPWLFGLVSSEVGVKRRPFPGRGWAIAALVGVAAWWGLRAVEHGRAMQLAMRQSIEEPSEGLSPLGQPVPIWLPVQQALVSPAMVNPFRWSAVLDFGPVYKLAEIQTLNGTIRMSETSYAKPGGSPAVRAAEASKLGRVYMDWSPMPFVQVIRPNVGSLSAGSGSAKLRGADAVAAEVTFRDPRFMGAGFGNSGISGVGSGSDGIEAQRTPLMGVVELDAGNHVLRESLDGRPER
jgi:inner membrane protein